MSIEKNNQVVLQVSHLKKRFGNNIVLDDFSFELHSNENIVVLGKSGSGKSVLIKCIIGLMKGDEGSINILGKEISEMNAEELDKIRAKIGFLFQSNALYDSMTVRENLEFPLRRHWIKYDKKEMAQIINQALTDVKLTHTIDMMPSELSGGMKKRIALARTLILKPEIILYDEPTTGLDPITAKEIIQLMIEIKIKYKTAALIISHDMNCVKLASDFVLMLIDGKCYANDTYSNLKNSQDKNIKQFFE
jgi:phospholipid/cholesterol/gamma-HCH transport system ATP-binding protein